MARRPPPCRIACQGWTSKRSWRSRSSSWSSSNSCLHRCSSWRCSSSSSFSSGWSGCRTGTSSKRNTMSKASITSMRHCVCNCSILGCSCSSRRSISCTRSPSKSGVTKTSAMSSASETRSTNSFVCLPTRSWTRWSLSGEAMMVHGPNLISGGLHRSCGWATIRPTQLSFRVALANSVQCQRTECVR